MHLLLLLTTAQAGRMPLTIQVFGPGGTPLPSTMIRFHEENQIQVMSDQGTYGTSVLFRPDGTTRDLSLGGRLAFDVWAPGHGPMLMVLELKEGKRNRATLRLSPSEWHTTGSIEGLEAVMAARRWEEAQLAWWAEPTELNELRARRLREATAARARQWIASLGDAPRSDAVRLCRMTAPDVNVCGEE